MKEELKNLKNEIAEIKDNHLAHLKIDVAKITTNQEWIMRFFWIVAGSSVAGLIAGILNLII